MSFQTLLNVQKTKIRRTQITFPKLDDFFVEFVATKKLLIIAESLRICLQISVKSGIKDRLHFKSVKFIGLCFERQQ